MKRHTTEKRNQFQSGKTDYTTHADPPLDNAEDTENSIDGLVPSVFSAGSVEHVDQRGVYSPDETSTKKEDASESKDWIGERKRDSEDIEQPNAQRAEESPPELNDQSEDGISGISEGLAYFGFCKTGKSHIERGVECQDKCCVNSVEKDGKTVLILSIADGLGSCKHSAIGAGIATQTSCEAVKNCIIESDRQLEEITIASIKKAMQAAYEMVESKAFENSESSDLYCSTLTIAVYDGCSLYIGHAGDDGVVVLSNSGLYALVTARHKGEEINSVYPLQSKETWEFLKVRDITGVILATDGVLDSFVRDYRENWRIFFPVLQPLITRDLNSAEKVQNLKEDYAEYMDSESYRSIVRDDLTFLAAINTKTVVKTNFKEFDLDEWIEQTKRFRLDFYNTLYPDKIISDSSIDKWILREKKLLIGIPSTQ